MEFLEEQRMINLGLNSEIMSYDHEFPEDPMVGDWLDYLWEKLPRGTQIGNEVMAG
jgi:hypothetical protein